MLGSSIAIVFVFLLALRIFADRGPLFLMRAVGLGLSVAIPFWFDVNWLSGKSVNALMLAGLFLILLVFSFFQKNKNSQKNDGIAKKIPVKHWFWFAVMVAMFTMVVGMRFSGKLDVPNYETPDGAIHFLYLSQTAKTGVMPQFLPSAIYPASGFSEDFKVHHLSYFPGAAVGFSMLNWFFGLGNSIVTLQIFNGLLYVLLIVYLLWLAYDSKLIFSRFGSLSLAVLLSLGTLFDFIVTSHTTQSFGLFMLIFFVDMVTLWRKKDVGLWLPMLALSSVIFSYLYWLPVALFYLGLKILPTFFGKKQNLASRNNIFLLLKAFAVVAGAFVLAFGYLKITYAVGVLGAATASGGFIFKQNFLADTVLVLPFALLGLFLFWKKNRNNENEKTLFMFTIATLLYTTLLYVAWRWLGKASDYVRLKVLYLTLPLGRIFVVYFFEQLFASIWNSKEVSWLEVLSSLFRKYKFVIIAVFVLEIFLLKSTVVSPFSVSIGNMKSLAQGGRDLNSEKNSLSREQVALLDEIKIKHPEALKDGRIMTIAPPGVGFWVFAYSGIWPMTDVLLGLKDASMNPWSGFNYEQWLKQDKEHYILYLDSEPSRGWVETYGMKFDDYKIIIKSGQNYLLKLPKGKGTSYFKLGENVGRGKLKGSVSSSSFVSTSDSLAGLEILLDSKKMSANAMFELNVYRGECKDGGMLLQTVKFTKEDIEKNGVENFYEIMLENPIVESEDESFCMRTFEVETKKETALIMNRKDEKIPLGKRYLFEDNLASN